MKHRNAKKPMERTNSMGGKLWLLGMTILHLAMIAYPFAKCWNMYYSEHIKLVFYWKGNWTIVALFVLLYFILVRVYDGLKLSLCSGWELIYSQALAYLITDGIMYIVICLLAKGLTNLWPGIACIAAQAVLSVVWSWIAHKWYFHLFPPQKTAVVYANRMGLDSLIHQYDLEKKFSVQATLSVEECLEDLSALEEYETVFLSGIHSHERNVMLKYCVEKDIGVYIIPRIGDVLMSGAKPVHILHLPILETGRYDPPVVYLAVKRLADILVSLLAIVTLSPVMLITALAIKSDGGPAFYRQNRLTKDGRVFPVLKFRSMRVDAEKDGVARLSTGDKDDRITPVGKVIRKIRFDELPQLFNILKGDMTIVGPRPERPEIAAEYEKQFPEFRLRLQAKAGLTGYAQVYGKYNTTPYDKLLMDLMYIAHPSIIEDLRIVLATIKILFMPESTEGIAEGSTTAIK